MTRLWLLSIVLLAFACSKAPEDEQGSVTPVEASVQSEGVPVITPTVRVATFNVSLFRDEDGALIEDMGHKGNPQIEAVAAIIRMVDPDIVVLNEFDYDADGVALALFQENYLYPEDEAKRYPYTMAFPSNTGVPSGVDFDGDGEAVMVPGSRAYGNDAFGYGIHPGQYAFAVLSRYPLEREAKRSFQTFKWHDMPDNLMPVDFYSEEAQAIFRLSSKNHVDIPVNIEGERVHLLLSHPTPPSFDGPEDRNGRRNHDELRLWADYIDPARGAYLRDDQGRAGGLEAGARFIILGDLNADPHDGDSYDRAINQLLDHEWVQATSPASAGAAQASLRQGGVNADHKGSPANDSGDFRDEGNGAIGNLRLDYVLPSKAGIVVEGSGIFWPREDEPSYEYVGPGFPPVSSDHHLVWVDMRIVPLTGEVE